MGLGADLTEAEADIAQNTDSVAHLKTDVVRIDAKDTEQDALIAKKSTIYYKQPAGYDPATDYPTLPASFAPGDLYIEVQKPAIPDYPA